MLSKFWWRHVISHLFSLSLCLFQFFSFFLSLSFSVRFCCLVSPFKITQLQTRVSDHSKWTKCKSKERGGKCTLIQTRRDRRDLTEIEIENRNREMNGKKLLNSQTQLIIVIINAKKKKKEKRSAGFNGPIQYNFRY